MNELTDFTETDPRHDMYLNDFSHDAENVLQCWNSMISFRYDGLDEIHKKYLEDELDTSDVRKMVQFQFQLKNEFKQATRFWGAMDGFGT